MMKLEDVMTLTEAAERWGLSDGAVIRMAIKKGKFRPDEVRKSGGTWLITVDAMRRVFGDERKTPPNSR